MLLDQVRSRYGSGRLAKGRLTNDTLTALSARDSKLAVLTANIKDFAMLREFLMFAYRPFDLPAI